jgi:septal ring factor EnvC (AmiA/AmiB activator)
MSRNSVSDILLSALFFTLALAQAEQPKVDEMQRQLQSIQEDISQLEKELKTKDNQLRIETKSVENVDKQITLTHNKIDIYAEKIRQQKTGISKLERQIDSLQSKIKVYQGIFKQQVIFAYKYQRGKQYNWIFGISGLNDLFIKYHYFRKVTTAERSVFEELQQSTTELNAKEQMLETEIAVTESYLVSATKEQENLKKKRLVKSQVISQLKQNKNLLSQALKEKKDSYTKLKNILASLEKSRPNRQLKVDTQIKWEKLSGNFSRNKGKFNWPVEGKVLHEFGRYKNPELKTVLNNTGIDLKATRGTNVRCIFPGVVSLITYMSGFGNMVIIDHNDGYYTVYAHLDEIFVNANDFVEGGNRIGSVGESGSLEGAKLHFEIYGNNQTLNPLEWLKKK